MKEVMIVINEDELWALNQAHQYFKSLHYSEMNKKISPNYRPEIAVEKRKEIEENVRYYSKIHMNLKLLWHEAYTLFENSRMEIQE